MNEKTVLKDCAGLNSFIDPVVTSLDGANGPAVSYLAKAVNVVISDSNKVEVVPGHTTLLSLTNGHSLFCDGGACLVCQGGSLYEVASNLSLSAAKRTGMSGNQIDYAQYGSSVLFGNRTEHGVYYQSTALSWDVDTYTGPPTDRVFESSVPFFDHIATFNGFVIGAIDNALFASELGKPGLWCMEPIWMSDTRIQMIAPVLGTAEQGGVFCSDQKRTYFLAGLNPPELVEQKQSGSPAIEWTLAHESIDLSTFSEFKGLGRVWRSTKGLSIGMPSGQIFDCTQKVIKQPTGYISGATAIIGTNIISTTRN